MEFSSAFNTTVQFNECEQRSCITTTVQFNECEQRSCINITIMDDDVLENTEFFNLTLERNGLHERIQLHPVDGLVQITNNDGTCTVVRPQYRTIIIIAVKVQWLVVFCVPFLFFSGCGGSGDILQSLRGRRFCGSLCCCLPSICA